MGGSEGAGEEEEEEEGRELQVEEGEVGGAPRWAGQRGGGGGEGGGGRVLG